MKKLISAVLLMAFMSVAQAQDCKSIYKEKARKRNNLHSALLLTAGAGVATAASAGIITLIGPAVIGGAAVTAGTKAATYGLYGVAIGSLALPTIKIKNKFQRVINILDAANSGNTNNKDFQKLVKKIRKQSSKLECDRISNLNDIDLNAEVSDFVIRANDNDELCPRVDVKGKQKVALFSSRSLAKYYVANYCE
jgi:hypothetical protein